MRHSASRKRPQELGCLYHFPIADATTTWWLDFYCVVPVARNLKRIMRLSVQGLVPFRGLGVESVPCPSQPLEATYAL